MKKLMAVLIVGLALIGGTAATAQAGSWRPGTPTMVSEQDMQDLLEKNFDWAYCSGIPRFGHKGEFPDETFVVFDCDMKMSNASKSFYCSDARLKAIKGSRRGYFKVKFLRDADCF